MNDNRRIPRESREKSDPGKGPSSGGSSPVRQSVLRTNWGRVLPQAPHADTDRTLTIHRPNPRARPDDDVPTHVTSRSSSGPRGREPRIAILGCGPAGLLAAHAVRLHGFRPTILSIKNKSQLSGAIYLHDPIPYLTGDVKSDFINYEKIGTREGYAEKVYGHPEAPCSWDHFEGSFTAYSMKQAYDILWIRYAHMVQHFDFGKTPEPEQVTQDYRLVINTIPRPYLCRNRELHQFVGADIWVSPFLPENAPSMADNVIRYNGDLDDFWYRSSMIFGHASTEAVFERREEAQGRMPGFAPGIKPIENNCDCNPRFHHVGRFGLWEKGVLAHEAFHDTMALMQREGIVDALF